MEDEEKELVETISKLKVLLVEYRAVRSAVRDLCGGPESFIEQNGVQNSISKEIDLKRMRLCTLRGE